MAGTDLRVAKQLLSLRKREVSEGVYQPEIKNASATTVEAYAEHWIAGRNDVITVADDDSRLKNHVLPSIGHMKLWEVDDRHILSVITSVRGKRKENGKPLAETTVKHVFTTMSTMFSDAVEDRLVISNPCRDVRKDKRPKRPKRAQTQRGYHTGDQVEALLSDTRIPWDRRIFFAIRALTGMRTSEVIGLRWMDYDPSYEQLGRIRLEEQWHARKLARTPLKGKRNDPGNPRDIPVHPTLAAILAEWKIEGFPKFFGRSPHPTDPIVPSRRDRHRSLRHSHRKFQQDCQRIGVPALTQHEGRNTFITLATAGGAPRAWIERITHNASGNILSGYTVNDWDAMCKAVKCIKVKRQSRSEVIPLRRAGSDDSFYDAGYDTKALDIKKPRISAGLSGGVDGTRTRGLRRDRPAL
jgi:integrase